MAAVQGLPNRRHQMAPKEAKAAHRLAAAFWPGPLTLILRRHPSVSDAITGGQDTVGLRGGEPGIEGLETVHREGWATSGGGFSRVFLGAERGDHPAIVHAHPGAVGVEDADDPGGHALVAVKRHGERLRVPFGLVIHRPRADGVDVAPVRLHLGVHRGVAVDL